MTTTALVWRSWRRHGRLTTAATAALVVLAPIAFLISGWSVDFGAGYNLAWQAVAPALLLAIALAGPWTRLVGIGVVLYAAVAVGAATWLSPTSDASATTLVVLATGLVWIAGWAESNRYLRAVGARAAQE